MNDHSELIARLETGRYSVSAEQLCKEAAAALREQAGEIERLNAKLPCGHSKDLDDSYGGCVLCQFKNGYEQYEAENEKLEAERDTLARENAGLRKDAGRYRWLRDRMQIRSTEMVSGPPRLCMEIKIGQSPVQCKDLDAAIDAAMEPK